VTISTVTTSWCLFFSSYSALFFLAAFRLQYPNPKVIACILGLIGVALMVWILAHAKELEPQEYTIRSVEDRGADVGNYLVAYLLPFLVVPDPGWGDLFAYMGFLLVAGLIYVKSDSIYVNPLLYLLGFRVARIETTDNYSGFLISKHPAEANSTITAARIRNSILVGF
jgi:hypothetical protein